MTAAEENMKNDDPKGLPEEEEDKKTADDVESGGGDVAKQEQPVESHNGDEKPKKMSEGMKAAIFLGVMLLVTVIVVIVIAARGSGKDDPKASVEPDVPAPMEPEPTGAPTVVVEPITPSDDVIADDDYYYYYGDDDYYNYGVPEDGVLPEVPGYSPIKAASLLNGRVVIGSFENTTMSQDLSVAETPSNYYINVSYVDFSLFNEENLVLYLVEKTGYTDLANLTSVFVRLPRVALESYPMELPSTFYPGDYEAIMLYNEDFEQNRNTFLMSSEFTVFDEEADITRPAEEQRALVASQEHPKKEVVEIETLQANDAPVEADAVSPEVHVPISRELQVREAALTALLTPISGAAVTTANSPQNQAFNWLLDGVGSSVTGDDMIVQAYVIVTLYYATGGGNWVNTFGITSDPDVCSWVTVNQLTAALSGILCDNFGKISTILLSSNNLVGSLIDELAELDSLQIFEVADNTLTGTIPAGLTSLTSLATLDVSGNGLSGQIPLLSGSGLRNVYLGSNAGLTGSVFSIFTEQVSNSIVSFGCKDCILSGPLPGTVIAESSLEELDLEGTGLSGTIPASLGSLASPTLKIIKLGRNSFSGVIPPNLVRLPPLEQLELFENMLAGIIPLSQISTNLKILNLNRNAGLYTSTTQFLNSVPSTIEEIECRLCEFTGDLPGGILLRFTNIKVFRIDNAGLTGNLPTQLGSLSTLTRLDLSSNMLGGVIHSSISTLRNLLELDLGNNTLTGEIPSFAGSQIQSIDLSDNDVYGSLLSFFMTAPQTLLEFSCDYCGFGGTLPGFVFSGRKNMISLDIENAGLTGTIPTQFGQMTSLTALELSGNFLDGGIPPQIGHLPNLENLELQGNNLEGNFPNFNLNDNKLLKLDLSDNFQLNGNLENFMANLPRSLEEFYCEKCRLNGGLGSFLGEFTNLKTLKLDDATLSGGLPDQLGDLTMLTRLDLANNTLQGDIPTSFSQLSNMQRLDLQYNFLVGNIPSFSTMTNLQELELNNNRFTGGIPSALAASPSLVSMDLGGNLLAGAMPSFSGSSFLEIDLDDNVGLSGNLTQIFTTLTTGINSFSCEKCILTGGLPGQRFVFYPNLQRLKLEQAGITGNIPSGIANLPSLISLELGGNLLQGNVPSQLQSHPTLQTLELFSNLLSGNVPTFAASPSIQILDLSNNFGLSGNATNYLKVIPNSLKELYLEGFSMAGTIPSFSKPNLEVLSLYAVSLTGNIPATLGNLQNLREIELGDNFLEGGIPAQVASLPKLEYLGLGENSGISGSIPSFLSATNLQVFDCDETGVFGNIGTFVSLLPPSIKEIRCEECELSGDLATSGIEKFQGLEVLKLQENSLSGNLPASLGDMVNLTRISLGENNLDGPIPASIANLRKLDTFEVYENSMTGEVPSFAANEGYMETFDISNNEFEGRIQDIFLSMPPESLDSFDVGANEIRGKIPTQVGLFPKLRRFKANDNRVLLSSTTNSYQSIIGTVPFQFSYLQSLEELRIEGNNIRGAFPVQVVNMPSLESLLIYDNRLRGDFSSQNNCPEQFIADCSLPARIVCDSGCCSSCYSSDLDTFLSPP